MLKLILQIENADIFYLVCIIFLSSQNDDQVMDTPY